MGRIDSKVLFVTTSPRTPEKMVPEISLLNSYFLGKKWDSNSQTLFMEILREENCFSGEGVKDPAFSARDRINRAPKSLGFVLLSPTIELTPAGKELISSVRTEEVFLRQLLKFQIPSPYHQPTERSEKFWIKPYLELIRLIRHFGSLKFDELMMFGLQLIDFRKFNLIIDKINSYRDAKANISGNYKKFKSEYFENELREIYKNELSSGNIKTRESKEISIERFLKTKSNNMRDYADACFRYLSATGCVKISHIGKSISIQPEKIKDVDYILQHTNREPICYNNIEEYGKYLGDNQIPKLLTDDRKSLVQRLIEEFPDLSFPENITIKELKNLFSKELENKKNLMIKNQVVAIKEYRLYDDIKTVFDGLRNNSLYDAPLMLEWNIWRAMTMLDGGEVRANLKFDDYGNPISTAQGNMADIVCDYGDFGITVEVTMQSGHRQYEAEGETVSRHLAKFKRDYNKPAYCLFIAPKINESCIAHFYALHKMNIKYYGGTSTIIPIPLNIFIRMLELSYSVDFIPEPRNIKKLFEYSIQLANSTTDETEWFNRIIEKAMNWLVD